MQGGMLCHGNGSLAQTLEEVGAGLIKISPDCKARQHGLGGGRRMREG